MPNSLRILAYLHSFEPGGVERVALRLCDAWARSGAAVTMLLGRTDGAMQDEAPDLDYALYSSGPVSTAPVETLWMIICLWRKVRADRPDVLFCAGNSYTIVAVALKILMGKRCPPVVAKVSNSLDRRDMNPAMRRAYRIWLWLQGRTIERWIGMAEPMRAEIAKAMSLASNHVEIIDDPALAEAEIRRLADARDAMEKSDARGRLFLSAGRLVPQKNFELLVRAFARGADGEDRLVILGDGPKRRTLEALIGELGLAGRVSLPGHVAGMTDCLAYGDAFLLASDYEGVPAVVIEAIASGMPVVATDCSVSMGDLVGYGRFGTLVPCGDQRALASAISDAGGPRPDREEARRHAARFTVERAAPLYLEVMRTVARQKPSIGAETGSLRRLRGMKSGEGSQCVSD